MKNSTVLKFIAAALFCSLAFSCNKPIVPELSISPKVANFEAVGASAQSIGVTSNVEWTASCDASWVTVTPASGNGNGKVTLTIADNTETADRNVELVFKAREIETKVKVSQPALAPELSVSPKAFSDLKREGESIQIAVTCNVAWTVTSNSDWLTPGVTEGNGNATLSVTVAPNESNIHGRSALLTIATTVGGKSVEVNIAQQAATPSPASDRAALIAIYNASDGANWAKNNWDLNADISTWNGVTVDASTGRVTALKITAAGTITKEWTLPEEVGDLTEITDLRLNQCKLTGPIPESIYDLPKLQKIFFQSDDLTGALSEKLGQLTELTDLYINGSTKLEGIIPTSIGNLTKLQNINIANTSIGGSIPQELSKCTALKNFMAFTNKLSGEIPDFWDNFPNLGVLQLYGNPGITGPIPPSIGTLKKATGIQLKECNLTGNIPASFAGLDKCGNLQLNGNKLKGVIPAEVQAHPKFLPTTGWKYEVNILPQQEGYGLTLQ